MNFDWILSDFETVIPPAARGIEPLRGQWMTAAFTIDGLAGKMIYANPDTGAPAIHIPLPLKGPYEIIVAMREDLCDKVKIKLGSDAAFDRIGYSFRGKSPGNAIQEVPWRAVTLSGREELIIKECPGHRLGIAFVAARKVAAPGPRPKKQYLLHLADDGYPGTWGMPEDDADAVWQVPAYKWMDADLLSHGVDVSGLANYPSRHASLRVPLEKMADMRPVHTLSSDCVLTRFTYQILLEDAARNRNVPKMVFAAARELGIKALGYMRMMQTPVCAPYTAIQTRLPRAHPEMRCIDIDGVPVTRMSIAYEEVRAEFIKLFTECVEMGAEGITNVYNRGVPLVLYEQPVLDAFRAKHGGDARELPENDPRVQAVRAEFVTQYMREQRNALDKAAGGKKVMVVASVLATQKACAFYGLDVATWAREGLIDMVTPYAVSFYEGGDEIDMPYFCGAVKGTGVKLLPYINTWRDGDPVAFLKSALRLTVWPIDGLSIWDPFQVVPAWRGTDFVEAVRSLGSAETIRECIEKLENNTPVRHILRTQQGMKMDKYHYGWGY